MSEFYTLDRVEGGLAVLLPLPPGKAQPVTLPLHALWAGLPAGRTRPADGTVFRRTADGQWLPAPEETVRRQALLQAKLQHLLEQ